MRDKKLNIAASATPQTLEYISTLCAYKRTHIEREQKRLEHLETMLDELTKLVKAK